MKWRYDGIQFVGVNVPGCDDYDALGSLPSDNEAFLEGGFREVRNCGALAVVVAMQTELHRRPSMTSLDAQLAILASSFPGAVRLLHGDFHPLITEFTPNYQGISNWYKVMVPGDIAPNANYINIAWSEIIFSIDKRQFEQPIDHLIYHSTPP